MNRLGAVSRAAVTAGLILMAAGCENAGRTGSGASNRPPPIEMAGSRWALVSLAGAIPDSKEPLTLEFGSDGRVSGFAGANRFSGPFELRSGAPGRGSLRVGELAVTRMAGSAEAMKQETAYLDLLRRADTYVAEGGLLELSVAGEQLLRFRQLTRRE